MTAAPRVLAAPALLLTTFALLATSCAGTPRTLTYHQVRSDRMSGARLSYSVWVPPDFRDGERLPLREHDQSPPAVTPGSLAAGPDAR